MEKLRDVAIDHINGLLAGHWKSPRLQALQSDLRPLTPEQQAIVCQCVIEAMDAGLHEFLFALSDEYDSGRKIAIVVEGQNIAAQSDGLHGELFGNNGWFAKYSKHELPRPQQN
jgi:hypothetical protein